MVELCERKEEKLKVEAVKWCERYSLTEIIAAQDLRPLPSGPQRKENDAIRDNHRDGGTLA